MAWRRKSTAQPDGDHRALMEQQAVELRQAAAVLRENAKAVEAEMRKAYAEIEELQRQNEILTRLMGSHAEEAIRPGQCDRGRPARTMAAERLEVDRGCAQGFAGRPIQLAAASR